MDNLTKEKRYRVMSSIKGKNTSPEMVVRRFVYSLGIRYRLHQKKLPGAPDLVFYTRKKIIHVNGCFWHMHDCKEGSRIPGTNSGFWKEKLNNNKKRDGINNKLLLESGWNILTLWECEINNGVFIEQTKMFLSNKTFL